MHQWVEPIVSTNALLPLAQLTVNAQRVPILFATPVIQLPYTAVQKSENPTRYRPLVRRFIQGGEGFAIGLLAYLRSANLQKRAGIRFVKFGMPLKRQNVISNLHTCDGTKVALSNDFCIIWQMGNLILMT
jgi:hypothetical protein